MPAPRPSPAATRSGNTPSSPPLAQLLEHAAVAVAAVRAGRSLTDALDDTPAGVRPGTQALAFHAMRHLGWAEALLEQLVPRRPPAWVEGLLLSSLSLLHEAADGLSHSQGPSPAAARPAPPLAGSGTPDPSYASHTVVDQAVRCAKRLAPAQSALVNAVLRRALREAPTLEQRLARDARAVWNHPEWWMDRLRADWPEHWQALLQANNQRAPMSLRVNARRGDAPGYLLRLREVGLSGRALGTHAVVLDTPQPVHRLPGFAQGDVSVQDLSAQLAAPLLLNHRTPGQPQSGTLLAPRARVLDACAAPGGKTGHVLELADVDLLALDADAQRLSRVGDNLARLGLRAELVCGDASQPQSWWDGRLFDAILLDAPCSASGIVRRHPDARWLRRASDIDQLARTQDALLGALWPLLRPGGRLVYCTCSVFVQEGQARVDAFLQRQPDAQSAAAPGPVLPVADNPYTAARLGVCVSDPSLFDGFFYAAIDKHAG